MLNSTNLYKAEWLNLVFKNRNQNYGAYTLRQQSAVITMRALLLASSVFILLFVGPGIYRHLKPVAEMPVVPDRVVEVDRLVQPEPVKEKKKEEPAPKTVPLKEKTNTVKLTANIKVVENPVIEENVPDLKDLRDAVIGSVNQKGPATQLQGDADVKPGGGISGGGTSGTDNSIHEGFVGLEVYPEFLGGQKGWAKFLQKNLIYPEMAQETGVSGKVFLSFVVEKDGSVSDVTLVKGIGGGCDEEAMRVIKKSPKWTPGIQNGRPVRVRYTMPLSFMINK